MSQGFSLVTLKCLSLEYDLFIPNCLQIQVAYIRASKLIFLSVVVVVEDDDDDF